MKKILYSFLLSLLCVTLLTGCFLINSNKNDNDSENGNSENQNPNGGPQQSGIELDLIISADNFYINEGGLLNDIYQATGIMPTFIEDEDAEVDGYEIVFGKTDRLITEMAYEYMSELPLTSDDAAFLIYRRGNKTAVIWNNNYICSEDAASYYVREFIPKHGYVGENAAEYVTKSISEFEEAMETEKWAKVKESVSEATFASLKQIYALFGEDTWTWIANLYDPDIGGFYYSNSARDYYGSGDHFFLPEVESTGQAFGTLRKGGMFDYFNGDYQDALSDEIKTQLGNFVYNLQDPDGYFYHPQWGKDITTAGRSRNLSSSVAILNRLGIKPKYTLPTEKLEDVEDISVLTSPLKDGSTVAAVSLIVPSSVVPTAGGLPEHLLSESNFRAYLSKLNFKTDSYTAGHTLSSQATEIKAAGLAEVCIEYLNSIQIPENGLWEPEIDYDTISGFLKISTTYQSLGGKLNYTDKAVESAMSLVLSTAKPNMMTRLYNPINAVANVLSNLSRQGSTEEISKIREYVKSVSDELVSVTYEKLLLFYRGDGSFSYYQKNCSTVSQGNVVAIECAEGDMNSTHLAIGAVQGLFKLLNLKFVRMFDETDLDGFTSLLNSMGTIVKSEYGDDEEIRTPDPITFEDSEIPDSINPKMAGTNGSYAQIVSDPNTLGNKVLEFASYPGYTDYLYMTRVSSTAENPDCFVFSADINFAEIKDVTTTDFRFVMEGLYYLDFSANKGVITLKDSSNKGSSSYTNTLPFTLETGKTYNLTFKYHLVDTVAYIEIYVDGELKCVSDNYTGRSTAFTEEEQVAASTKYKRAYFFALKGSELKVHVDNVLLDRTNEEFTPPPECNVPIEQEKTPDTLTFDGSTAFPSTVTTNIGGSKEGASCDIVADGDGEGNHLELTSVPGFTDYVYFNRNGTTSLTPNCFIFSFDINFAKVEDVTTADFRFVMEGLYFVNVTVTDGKIVLEDNSNKSSNSYKNIMPFTLETGNTYHIEFKYHLVDTVAYIETYVNGDLKYVSDNYVGRSTALGDEQPAASTKYTRAYFFAFKDASLKVHIDNVFMDRVEEEFTVPDNSKRPVGNITFDDSTDIPSDVTYSIGSSGSLSVIEDTKSEEDGNCLLLDTKSGGIDYVYATYGEVSAKDGAAYIFEADMCFKDSTMNKVVGRIYLDSLYYINIRSYKDGCMKFCPSTDDSEHLYSVKFGTWFNIRIAYYIISDTEARIITTIDGNTVEDKTVSYNSSKSYNKVEIRALKDGVYKLYIDDIFMDITSETPPADADGTVE